MHGENGKGSLLRSKEEKLRVIGMQCINWEEIRSVTNKDLYRSPGQKNYKVKEGWVWGKREIQEEKGN